MMRPNLTPLCLASCGLALVVAALVGCATPRIAARYDRPLTVRCFDGTTRRGTAVVVSPRHAISAAHVLECPRDSEPMDIRVGLVEVVEDRRAAPDGVRLVAVGVGEPWQTWARSWRDLSEGDSGTPLMDPDGKIVGLVLSRWVDGRATILSVDTIRALIVDVPQVSLEPGTWPLRYGPSGDLRGSVP